MGNFNRDFSEALRSKLALQESQGRNYDARANLRNEQAGVVGADSRAAIDLRGAQAGDYREQTRLREDAALSASNLNDQQARTSRIGANIKLGDALLGQDRALFESSYRNYEGGGQGGVDAFSATAPLGSPSAVDITPSSRGVYGEPFAPGRSENRARSLDVLDKNSAFSQRQRLGFADGGLVEGTANFAGGGIVEGGAPDSSLTADYALYREAAANAGVPVLPIQEAIPRMAQIRATKRKEVLDMISQGGTTPPGQGFADGGEIIGPGTGKSDSIPAVVDGTAPAAVSDGEFRIPKHIVDYFGTKMFDSLIEKARMAGKASQRKQGALANAPA